jgi:polar amino acid transport system substrate-binding protein
MFCCRRRARLSARFLLSVLSLLSLPMLPHAAELVLLVDTATEMPMARFERHSLVDGMQKDIGEALARAMGRQPRFMALPRKRLMQALLSGNADVLCGFVPEWVDGPFGWSQPFLPLVEVVITDRGAVAPRSLADLAHQPVGTVSGYLYPELERALGKGFARDDGPSTSLNLRKLAAGRLHHVVTMKNFVDYRVKRGDPRLALHPPLMVKTYMTRCAVSNAGRASVPEVERAVDQLLHDGTISKITARYQ